MKKLTDYTDYPEHTRGYAMRDPNRLIAAAESKGTNIGRFMAALLSGDFPWAKLRQGQKLMRLGDKYGHRRVDDACRRAVAFEIINVRRVERIIGQSLDAEPGAGGKMTIVPLPTGRFARPNASFGHSTQPEGEDS